MGYMELSIYYINNDGFRNTVNFNRCFKSTIIRCPPTIQRISILIRLRFMEEFSREPLSTFSISHAGCLAIYYPTWTIWRFTIAYKNGSSPGLGNSAWMTESIWVGLSFSLSQKRLCTCGRPRFWPFYGIHVGSKRPTHVKFRHKIYQQNDFPLKDSRY